MSETKKTILTDWKKRMESAAQGDFVRFDDGDEKLLKIVAGPFEGTNQYGKVQFDFEVLVGDDAEIRTWHVMSRGIIEQMISISKKEGVAEWPGVILRVTATGAGKERRWLVRLISKPGAKT